MLLDLDAILVKAAGERDEAIAAAQKRYREIVVAVSVVRGLLAGDSAPGSITPSSDIPTDDAPQTQTSLPPATIATLSQEQSSPAPKRQRSQRIRCAERPGLLMTLEEAAAVVCGKKSSLTACLAPSSPNRGHYKGLHFYRDGDQPPIALPAPAIRSTEDRPAELDHGASYVRRRGGTDAMPINGMRLPAAEKPTPEEFRADPISEPALHKRLQRDNDSRGLHKREPTIDPGTGAA